MVRFRCRVGHAYSPETLLAVQSDSVEAAIWAGLRALEENAALMRRMSTQMRNSGNERSALRFHDQALSALRRAEVLRLLILDREPITEAEATVNE
jgi:two-component system chemotaxis response regulator CheB